MKTSKLSILLLCDDQRGHANTVLDHISAFPNLSQHNIYKYNPCNVSTHHFLDLNEFDVVVIHYSLSIITDYYLAPGLRRKVKEFQGLKIQYIQDDYRHVDQYTDMMRFLEIDVLFTPYMQEKIPFIYDEERLPRVLKKTSLTGYVPERLKKLSPPPTQNRPVDVGYRGRSIPYWLGILSQEKRWIGEGFLKFSSKYKLKTDISSEEHDRIYGKKWDKFVSSCKSMLGTESGVSITDFDGMAELKSKNYLSIHPQADFWEVYENILKPYEGNLVENTISPRVFECAAHRTAMVLFPGDYSGILHPWEHYIPLQKDFSNIEEVIKILGDNDYLQSLADRTYTDIIASGKYSYGTMIKEFDGIVESRLLNPIPKMRPKTRFLFAKCERILRFLLKIPYRFVVNIYYTVLLLSKDVRRRFTIWK